MRTIVKLMMLTACITGLTVSSAYALWQVNTVRDEGDIMYTVKVGEGRNNTITAVYAGGKNDNVIYEYIWNGGAWDRTAINGGVWDCTSMVLGDARNNGQTRIVTGNESYAQVDEFYYNGLSWSSGNIGQMEGGHWDGNAWSVDIGPGRNDGTNRVYAGSAWGSVKEYTWSGSAWSETSTVASLGNNTNWVTKVAPGRNGSGTNYVYVGCADGRWREYYWNGTAWNRTDEYNYGGAVDVTAAYVGIARNGGTVMRTYVGLSNGDLYERRYNGGWQTPTRIAQNLGCIWGLEPGLGRNDGVKRLYIATENNVVYEMFHNGTSWDTPVVIGPTMPNKLNSISIGPGRNTSSNNQIYVTSPDHKVYEYCWVTPTFTVTPTPTITPTVNPNTPTITPTIDVNTQTYTPTSTRTATVTETSTISPTSTETPPYTLTPTPTITMTPTATVSATITQTPTISVTATISVTRTITPTCTITRTITVTVAPYPDLANVVVFPNPYKSKEKNTQRITFARLTQQAEIRIYTLNGELVTTLSKDDLKPVMTWNLKNNSGQPVASGIYIYVIKNGTEQKRGKVVLLR